MMHRFRAWLANGDVWDSSGRYWPGGWFQRNERWRPWEELEDVVGVVHYFDTEWAPGKAYREYIKGDDWIYLDESGHPRGSMKKPPRTRKPKEGKQLPDPVWAEIVSQMTRAEVW